jgi:hypothetical protein
LKVSIGPLGSGTHDSMAVVRRNRLALRFDAKDAVDVPRTNKLATPAMANSAPGKEEREINAAEAVPLATPSQTDQAHIHIQTVIAYSRCRTRLTPYLGCP